MAPDEQKNESLKFEEALARLEGIVMQMEGGQLSLEDCMKRFEQGMELTRYCCDKLGETEKKVEILLQKADGALAWQEIEAESSADDDTDDASDSC